MRFQKVVAGTSGFQRVACFWRKAETLGTASPAGYDGVAGQGFGVGFVALATRAVGQFDYVWFVLAFVEDYVLETVACADTS